mmetsp:Transcript_18239/g.34736  ORF Transcript_18239/g.34736 Transcript_18239/m.34736 type:complete len:603 (-) Transcript_18239:278-2086(-)
MTSTSRTKVVVRKLPPTLSEDAFRQALPASILDRCTWLAYYVGKHGSKRTVPSRAYLNFKRMDDVLEFCSFFHDYLFVSERGSHFRAQVEFAPFQGVPKARQRKDPREGTIDTDADYLEFLQELNKPVEPLPSAEVQLERREAEEKETNVNSGAAPIIITPLMQYLKLKSEEKRSRSTQQKGNQRVAVASKPASAGGSSGKKERARGEKERKQGDKASKAERERDTVEVKRPLRPSSAAAGAQARADKVKEEGAKAGPSQVKSASSTPLDPPKAILQRRPQTAVGAGVALAALRGALSSAPAGGERGRRAPKGSSALAPDERGADLDMAKSDEAQPGHPSKGGRSGPDGGRGTKGSDCNKEARKNQNRATAIAVQSAAPEVAPPPKERKITILKASQSAIDAAPSQGPTPNPRPASGRYKASQSGDSISSSRGSQQQGRNAPGNLGQSSANAAPPSLLATDPAAATTALEKSVHSGSKKDKPKCGSAKESRKDKQREKCDKGLDKKDRPDQQLWAPRGQRAVESGAGAGQGVTTVEDSGEGETGVTVPNEIIPSPSSGRGRSRTSRVGGRGGRGRAGPGRGRVEDVDTAIEGGVQVWVAVPK